MLVDKYGCLERRRRHVIRTEPLHDRNRADAIAIIRARSHRALNQLGYRRPRDSCSHSLSKDRYANNQRYDG